MSAISIIIPVYNAEKYIARCLDAILNQSFSDFKVILVNDGSTDGSLTLCKVYCEKDSRFTVLDKPNGGAASARNLGLDWYYRESDSPWFCFLDADDFVEARYLELLYAAVRDNSVSVSMCAFQMTDRDALEPVQTVSVPVLFSAEELWCKHQLFCTVPVVKLFARDLFRDIRFPEGIIHEDEFTLYKVLFKCEQIAFINVPLYGYYQTETSVMRGAWSPRHMKEPEGIAAQLCFFRENHYQKAAAYTAKIYLLSLYNNLLRCRTAGEQYREYAVELKKRLGKGLKQYKSLAGVSIDGEPWLFYEAFPVGSLPHRLQKRIFSRKKK